MTSPITSTMTSPITPQDAHPHFIRAPLRSRRFWHTFFTVIQFSYRSVSLRKASWFGTLVFAGCLLILFPFAFGTEAVTRLDVRYGAFWAINEFMVALTVSRLFSAEQECGALEFLLASRASRASVLLGKTVFTAFQLLTLQVPLLCLWIVFYNIPAESLRLVLGTLIPVCVLFNLGTASLGALITCITARSQAREILIPILFYPLQVALLLGSVTLCFTSDTSTQLLGTFSTAAWWSILGTYPVIFSAMGFLLGDALLQE